ncbi:MAG: DUF4402 domain-containing protein [Alphaproteobacteria bacterium]|nr:DUF4402 domain-containing protein [Alphaproteobacteria bacterium]MBN2780078.1 DUF4402 domain-containing protein [Alphaproteobacteria bacterium]
MKQILFILGLLLTSNTFAATGTGHAQTELTNPLSITETTSINFGAVAIDPAAGPQEMILSESDCPATYVCTGQRTDGLLLIKGNPWSTVYVSIEGETAILSDGNGNTIVFDPSLGGADTRALDIFPNGERTRTVNGKIYFTGSEPAGTYSSENAGGSGYQITVNY